MKKKKKKKKFWGLKIYAYEPAGGSTHTTVAISDQKLCCPYVIL
jgi:hypothetical protein